MNASTSCSSYKGTPVVASRITLKSWYLASGTGVLSLLCTCLNAQEPAAQPKDLLAIPAPQSVPAPGPPTEQAYAPTPILPGGIVIPLYPADSPLLNQEKIREPEKYSMSGDVPGRINSIVNIHNPSIEVHRVSGNLNTGAVVIVAAGGGHRTLNVGGESADFVPFFFNYGINTVILRNRLRSDGYDVGKDAVHDAMQAIRLVRKHAADWKFDPNKIGIMGFSAGAELAAPAAIDFEKFDADNSAAGDPLAGVSSRPDFIGLIYPGPSPFAKEPERDFPLSTPPAFIVCPGAGDRVHAIWANEYFTAMLKKGVPNVEMHIYGNGYHPGDRGMSGGMTYRKGIPFGKWQYRFIEWFEDAGFMGPIGVETKAAAESREFVNNPPRQRPNRR
jgi:endo-1,4-beta-xylanase